MASLCHNMARSRDKVPTRCGNNAPSFFLVENGVYFNEICFRRCQFFKKTKVIGTQLWKHATLPLWQCLIVVHLVRSFLCQFRLIRHNKEVKWRPWMVLMISQMVLLSQCVSLVLKQHHVIAMCSFRQYGNVLLILLAWQVFYQFLWLKNSMEDQCSPFDATMTVKLNFTAMLYFNPYYCNVL